MKSGTMYNNYLFNSMLSNIHTYYITVITVVDLKTQYFCLQKNLSIHLSIYPSIYYHLYTYTG